jgi:hypothetical protein
MSSFTQMPKGIENHVKMYLEKSFQKKKKEKTYFSIPPSGPSGPARPTFSFPLSRPMRTPFPSFLSFPPGPA